MCSRSPRASSGCRSPTRSRETRPRRSGSRRSELAKLKVIYDTDPGVDDAMALLLLARHPDVELIGVTTCFGNGTIETTTRNALYLKQLFGFVAPVAKGAGVA